MSWLSATLHGVRVLAFIPKDGIFVWHNKFYFAIQLYPLEMVDETYGLRCTTIPPNYQPRMEIVRADWQGWENVMALWPSLQKSPADGSIVFHFVSSS